jgi:hypothetical protein
MPLFGDVKKDLIDHLEEYWKERREEAAQVRKDMETYLGIPQDSMLARKFAWWLVKAAASQE